LLLKEIFIKEGWESCPRKNDSFSKFVTCSIVVITLALLEYYNRIGFWNKRAREERRKRVVFLRASPNLGLK
jgi:hypothetical protein